MDLPTVGGLQKLPAEGCREQAETRTAMRSHLLQRHVRDTMIILDEGNLTHPRFPRCHMLVPWKYLNRKHVTTAQCKNREERKRRPMAEENIGESATIEFHAYRRPINMVTYFKYLGQVIRELDNNWSAVAGNLWKAHTSWYRLTRILGR